MHGRRSMCPSQAFRPFIPAYWSWKPCVPMRCPRPRWRHCFPPRAFGHRLQARGLRPKPDGDPSKGPYAAADLRLNGEALSKPPYAAPLKATGADPDQEPPYAPPLLASASQGVPGGAVLWRVVVTSGGSKGQYLRNPPSACHRRGAGRRQEHAGGRVRRQRHARDVRKVNCCGKLEGGGEPF